MTDITRRETLLMTAGATWAVALGGTCRRSAERCGPGATAGSEACQTPREPPRFRAPGARDHDAGGLGVHQQRRRR